jgi:hypothetical protein
MKDTWDIKRVLEGQRDAYNKVEIQSNSEFQSLTSSPIQSSRSPYLQIDARDMYYLRFSCSIYMHEKLRR